jgi:hypothetical protein
VFPHADISSRNWMKVRGTIATIAMARAVRSIEPVECVKPENWMVRNVRA